MSERLYFLIEGPGTAMDLVKASIEERLEVHKAAWAFIQKVGGTGFSQYFDGRIGGVRFEGKVPTGWKAKDTKGLSRPRKDNAEAIAEIKAIPTYKVTSDHISEQLGIPDQITYLDDKGECCGFEAIGVPFHECGFGYPSGKGPYVLWMPNVPELVATSLARRDKLHHGKISPELASYRPSFEGCRQIIKEEWDLIVAGHALEQKKKGGAA
jgi:hypothetical protein